MSFNQHNHGGQLQLASIHYQIPLANWVDLSTGINPTSYPLPTMPTECWQRLPETNDGLETAAADYYGSEFLLAVSGSQEAIQRLPKLFPKQQRIGIIKPAYHSHQQAWQSEEHSITTLTSGEVDGALSSLDVLLVVNPSNPSTEFFSAEALLNWHQKLAPRGGTLIVDEAFIDATPENSLITKAPKQGLIVLRSIGKFFGLAGVRLGFVWAEKSVLKALAELQDDWSVSHPARWAGKTALLDTEWQAEQRKQLPTAANRLLKMLENCKKQGGCVYKTSLFAYFEHQNAQNMHKQLAKEGILTRLFTNPASLRFGLPANNQEWQRLADALQKISCF